MRLKLGDGENPGFEWLANFASGIRGKAVAAKAGEILQGALAKFKSRPGGSWPSGSFNLASVGSLHSATSAAGTLTSLGVRSRKPAAKSLTMKGAKALGSKF